MFIRLFSNISLIAFPLLAIVNLIYYWHVWKKRGVLIVIYSIAGSIVLFFIAAQINNPRAMGWDFGLTTAIALFLAFLICLAGFLSLSIYAFIHSLKRIRALKEQGKPLPFVEYLPGAGLGIVVVQIIWFFIF
jgi:hypothetical protein